MKHWFNVIVLHRVVDDLGESAERFDDISTEQLSEILAHPDVQFCTIDEASSGARNARYVCLTFDDGCESHHSVVLPYLEKCNAKATFFVVSSWIGKPGYLCKEQILELKSRGMQIGSHSHTHRSFFELSDKEIMFEIRESKKILEEILEEKISCFAFPYGHKNKRILNFVKSEMKICCTSSHGVNFSGDRNIYRNSINSFYKKNMINRVVEAKAITRFYWAFEDFNKRFFKKIAPGFYPVVRNVVFRLIFR